MAINFTTYFTRVGNEIGFTNVENTYRGSDLATRIASMNALYTSTDRYIVDGFQTVANQFQSSQNTFIGSLQQIMQNTLIQMCNADVPLQSLTLPLAVTRLIQNMLAGSQTINRPTLGATVTAGTNVGDGTLAVSTIDSDGLPLDYMMGETLIATVTNDSYPGNSATSGQEPYQILGFPAVNALDWNWPQGSGGNATGNAVSIGSSTTLATNGGFENWTTNVPNGWTIDVGAYTTNYLQSSSSYAGSYAFEFVGDSATNTTISTSIATNLRPSTVYVLGYWAKRSGSGTGAVQFNLTGPSPTYTTFNNQQGTANSVTVTASSGYTTSYAPYTAFFQTPAVMPANARLQIKLSTALATGTDVFIDNLTLAPARQCYAGGPWVSLIAGVIPFATNDTFSVAATNSLGVSSFARSLDRYYNLKGLNQKIPSSGSPTISDGLIT